MPTIAIIGAGPGLGLALARTFGAHGYSAAIIARNADTLDSLVATLKAEGIVAERFVADTADAVMLAAALADAEAQLGTIDVLEFSPYSAGPSSMLDPIDVTVEKLASSIQAQTYGAVTAVQAVLPAMRERGQGTILLTAGIGSIDPVPIFGAMNAAQAATRNWALNLHKRLAGSGVTIAHIAIGLFIGAEPPKEGYPFRTPEDIAAEYWTIHETGNGPELVIR
ncbi:SDR family NAD(P)-dependent oxidoreductase [Microbacterium sp.]|uniref:SDR family NAD(P)-dependent oxidoreductase n=1 Tax=Microbacterium sp. TaxID=51671 RepID=UPI003A87FE49